MHNPVVLKTKYLFLILLHYLQPKKVMDVGSMNGADSRRFRRMLPHARITAFEANPHLYHAMIADPLIGDADIQVVNRIVSATPGTARFYITKPATITAIGGNRGTSSSLRRVGADDSVEEVELPTVNLADYLQGPERAALWIDVEGAGYDVFATIGPVADRVACVHIECELQSTWQGQKLKPEVVALAESMGFELIAHSSASNQQDLVFVHRTVLMTQSAQVNRALLMARVHGPLFARILEGRG